MTMNLLFQPTSPTSATSLHSVSLETLLSPTKSTSGMNGFVLIGSSIMTMPICQTTAFLRDCNGLLLKWSKDSELVPWLQGCKGTCSCSA